MKNFTLTIVTALLFPCMANAQKAHFTLRGNIENDVPGTKILMTTYYKNERSTDTVYTDGKGHYIFEGTLTDPVMSTLRLIRGGDTTKVIDETIFYLDKGDMTASKVDSMYKTRIQGSASTDDFYRLQKMMKVEEDAFQNRMRLNGGNLTKEQRATEFKAYQQKRKEVFAQFVKENPNSFVSIDAIKQIVGPLTDLEIAKGLFTSLSPSLQKSQTGKGYYALLTAIANVSVGMRAPLIAQPDTLGNLVSLTDLRGKYVLLDFWASWCIPCRSDNPFLIETYNKFKNKGFTILGISLDRDNQAWRKAILDDGLPWTQVADLKGVKQNEAAIKYGVQAIPQNFLLDPLGRIIGKNLRGEALTKKLEEVLNGNK